MHTTIAFHEEMDEVLAAWANIAAVPDAHIKTEGDYVYMGEMNKIIGFYGLPGTTATMIRLSAPSIRRVNPYYIPVFETAIQSTGLVRRAFFPNINLALIPGEGLECEQYTSVTDEHNAVIVFLANATPAPVQGNIHTIRFSCEPVESSFAWSFSEITLLDPLPVGAYDIVGARLLSDVGIAFRLVPLGGSHRPGGVVSLESTEDEDTELQRYGGLGVWCSFIHGQTPGIEMISSATDVKKTIYGFLDIIPK